MADDDEEEVSFENDDYFPSPNKNALTDLSYNISVQKSTTTQKKQNKKNNKNPKNNNKNMPLNNTKLDRTASNFMVKNEISDSDELDMVEFIMAANYLGYSQNEDELMEIFLTMEDKFNENVDASVNYNAKKKLKALLNKINDNYEKSIQYSINNNINNKSINEDNWGMLSPNGQLLSNGSSINDNKMSVINENDKNNNGGNSDDENEFSFELNDTMRDENFPGGGNLARNESATMLYRGPSITTKNSTNIFDYKSNGPILQNKQRSFTQSQTQTFFDNDEIYEASKTYTMRGGNGIEMSFWEKDNKEEDDELNNIYKTAQTQQALQIAIDLIKKTKLSTKEISKITGIKEKVLNRNLKSKKYNNNNNKSDEQILKELIQKMNDKKKLINSSSADSQMSESDTDSKSNNINDITAIVESDYKDFVKGCMLTKSEVTTLDNILIASYDAYKSKKQEWWIDINKKFEDEIYDLLESFYGGIKSVKSVNNYLNSWILEYKTNKKINNIGNNNNNDDSDVDISDILKISNTQSIVSNAAGMDDDDSKININNNKTIKKINTVDINGNHMIGVSISDEDMIQPVTPTTPVNNQSPIKSLSPIPKNGKGIVVGGGMPIDPKNVTSTTVKKRKRCQVRETVNPKSKIISKLVIGVVITIQQLVNNVAKISSPVNGFVNIKDNNGIIICENDKNPKPSKDLINARKLDPSTSLPQKYRICVHPGAKIKEKYDTNSKVIAMLPIGKLVNVVEIQGRRCRIDSPVKGWTSLYSSDGHIICEKETSNSTIIQRTKQDKEIFLPENKVGILKLITTLNTKTCQEMLKKENYNLKKCVESFYIAKYKTSKFVMNTNKSTNIKLKQTNNKSKKNSFSNTSEWWNTWKEFSVNSRPYDSYLIAPPQQSIGGTKLAYVDE